MPEIRRLKTPTRRSTLSLTSLIDVIFLLLLFFMLTSTFSRLGELELTAAPQGMSAAPSQPPAFVQLSREAIRLNAEDVRLEDLRARLFVTAGTEGLVLIAMAEGVTAQRLVDVLAVLRGVPFSVRVLA